MTKRYWWGQNKWSTVREAVGDEDLEISRDHSFTIRHCKTMQGPWIAEFNAQKPLGLLRVLSYFNCKGYIDSEL